MLMSFASRMKIVHQFGDDQRKVDEVQWSLSSLWSGWSLVCYSVIWQLLKCSEVCHYCLCWSKEIIADVCCKSEGVCPSVRLLKCSEACHHSVLMFKKETIVIQRVDVWLSLVRHGIIVVQWSLLSLIWTRSVKFDIQHIDECPLYAYRWSVFVS